MRPHSVVDPAEFLSFVKSAFKFNLAADGSFDVVNERGKTLDFDEAFKDWAVKKSFLFDGRTIKSLSIPPSEITMSDMTTAQKSAYITKHGLAAYEKLDLYPRAKVNISTITGDEYRKLPSSEKVKIIERVGEQGVSAIMRRKG